MSLTGSRTQTLSGEKHQLVQIWFWLDQSSLLFASNKTTKLSEEENDNIEGFTKVLIADQISFYGWHIETWPIKIKKNQFSVLLRQSRSI